jgi:hypothetical protein
MRLRNTCKMCNNDLSQFVFFRSEKSPLFISLCSKSRMPCFSSRISCACFILFIASPCSFITSPCSFITSPCSFKTTPGPIGVPGGLKSTETRHLYQKTQPKIDSFINKPPKKTTAAPTPPTKRSSTIPYSTIEKHVWTFIYQTTGKHETLQLKKHSLRSARYSIRFPLIPSNIRNLNHTLKHY